MVHLRGNYCVACKFCTLAGNKKDCCRHFILLLLLDTTVDAQLAFSLWPHNGMHL